MNAMPRIRHATRYASGSMASPFRRLLRFARERLNGHLTTTRSNKCCHLIDGIRRVFLPEDPNRLKRLGLRFDMRQGTPGICNIASGRIPLLAVPQSVHLRRSCSVTSRRDF